jgi:hypothetical protein
MSEFKKIIERTALDSSRQTNVRLGAYAETKFNDRGTTVRPGDVINMPYEQGQQSLIEAIGQAYVTASGKP